MPNLTLPKGIADDALDCAVFGKKRRLFGSVRRSGGVLLFTSDEILSQNERPDLPQDDTARIVCLSEGCEAALDGQFKRSSIATCLDDPAQMEFAGAIVEGWLSDDWYSYGHLHANWSRVLVIDKVVEVFDPPSVIVDEWRDTFARTTCAEKTQ